MPTGRVGVLASALFSLATASCASILGLERGELREDDATLGDVDGGRRVEGYSELVLAEGPLAYYPFEEAAGAARVQNRAPIPSPRERDGAVSGATLGLTGARGAGDRSMTAAAPGARVELTWAGLPAGNEPFSVEVAVRPRAIEGEPRIVFAHHDTTGGTFAGFRLFAEGTELVFERAASSGQSERLRADHALTPDRWTHLAVTFDGGRLRLLVGGAVVDEVRTGLRVDGSGTTLTVGSRDAGEPPFAGSIDELAIYPREVPDDVLRAHADLLR